MQHTGRPRKKFLSEFPAQSGPNGPIWPEIAQSSPAWPKWPKVAQEVGPEISARKF